jgi:hypothetical protein
MFDHKELIERFLQSELPINAATHYGVEILPVVSQPVPNGSWYWKVLGVYHLLPEENLGMRNLFLEVIDTEGTRMQSEIAWRWEGQQPHEKPRPVLLDKPDNEPGGNIALDFGQTVTAWVDGTIPSEAVAKVHTRHPDEPMGNSIGHHSFFVVWQLTKRGGNLPPIDPPPEPDCEGALVLIAQLSKLIDEYYETLE